MEIKFTNKWFAVAFWAWLIIGGSDTVFKWFGI